jgi:hypothetical protein
MPGMGGEELAEIAVTLRPGIRVVFTSGFQTPPGNAAFVPKPYRAVDLMSRIRTLGPPWEKTRSAPIGTPPISNFCTVYRNSDGFHDLAGRGSQVRTRLSAGGSRIRTPRPT